MQCGTDSCVENIKNKKVYLLILAEDVAKNTKDKFVKLSKNYSVDLIIFGDRILLNNAIGKEDKVVFAITDSGFAKSIMQLINDLKGAN